MIAYEILSGGERLDSGAITGPYSVIVIADNGKVRKMVDRRQSIADIQTATTVEDFLAETYKGASFPWGRIADNA